MRVVGDALGNYVRREQNCWRQSPPKAIYAPSPHQPPKRNSPARNSQGFLQNLSQQKGRVLCDRFLWPVGTISDYRTTRMKKREDRNENSVLDADITDRRRWCSRKGLKCSKFAIERIERSIKNVRTVRRHGEKRSFDSHSLQ